MYAEDDDGDPLAGRSLAEVDSASIEARLRTLEERSAPHVCLCVCVCVRHVPPDAHFLTTRHHTLSEEDGV
jgi:hypothetical protein